MQNKRLKFFILISFITITSFAQTSDQDLMESGKEKYSQKQYNKAYEDFDDALRLNPKNAEAYFYLALVFDKVFTPKTTESINLKISLLNTAIKLNPNYKDAYFYRGVEKFYLKEYENAISDYNRILEKDVDNFQCYTYRGMAKSKLNDNDGAMLDFDKAIKLNTNYSLAYGMRGHLNLKLKQKEAACLDFKKAVELGENAVINFVEKTCN
jgi:tetratricopeptide (TPR) repeat protein